MAGKPASAQHLSDLVRLRRVRDRIAREYAHPLDVEALARGAHMSVAVQLPDDATHQVAKPVRNREAPATSSESRS